MGVANTCTARLHSNECCQSCSAVSSLGAGNSILPASHILISCRTTADRLVPRLIASARAVCANSLGIVSVTLSGRCTFTRSLYSETDRMSRPKSGPCRCDRLSRSRYQRARQQKLCDEALSRADYPHRSLGPGRPVAGSTWHLGSVSCCAGIPVQSVKPGPWSSGSIAFARAPS